MTALSSDAFAVVMAGGAGTRFWPASRRAHPKQLLSILGDQRPLIQATVDRLRGVIPTPSVFVVTNESLAEQTSTLLPAIPRDNLLLEPVGRNTAPCVGWAAAHVRRRNPHGVIAVLPADHHIEDEAAFRETISRALAIARDGGLVTVGIEATRPETGYGYIERGEALDSGAHRAQQFVEKPPRAQAEEFVRSGRFLWNSGMFFFRADTILEAIQKHLPLVASALAAFDEAAARGQEAEVVRQRFETLPSISIDHGVMEKCEEVLVLPANFGWSDLGSWISAWELSERDAQDNAVAPGAVTLDTTGCYVRSTPGKVVALIGVQDLVVVDTEDALVVMPKDRAQDVRQVVDALADRGDDRYL